MTTAKQPVLDSNSGSATTSDFSDPAVRARFIRDRIPVAGLFAGQEWRIAPEPLALGPKLARELENLGRILLQFYRASNLLYRRSTEGKQPEWVARWLDQGKPGDLVDLQRSPTFKNEVPRVIRPDLLITEHGISITELDSVPGGIGVTAWLNQIYSAMGQSVLGGPNGMIEGFGGIFDNDARVHIVVSEEAAAYRPEMEWLCEQLDRAKFTVRGDGFEEFQDGDGVYRFFELFDLQNVANSRKILSLARDAKLHLTPPPKPILEEKMLFTLLWNRNLRGFWLQNLGESFLEKLQRLVPYSWMVDPAPLPPHAAVPELNLTDWQQLKTLSQRERELILKVSGFSEKAWGARGVYLGSDLSHADWSAAVDAAISGFGTSPFVLQRYHHPKLVCSAWYDFSREKVVDMDGRVRLSPYYFVMGSGDSARARLGGVLATICPADKKIIHGMKDAIFTSCSVGSQESG